MSAFLCTLSGKCQTTLIAKKPAMLDVVVFVCSETSKTGTTNMPCSSCNDLDRSHGGSLPVVEEKKVGSTFATSGTNMLDSSA
jgi:hypothetical protein